MNTWKVILATLVIFAAGVFTGGLLVKQTSPPPPIPPPRDIRVQMLQRLARGLNLTAVQNEQIEQILHEGQERSKIFWDLLEPELHAEFRKTREEILEVLTPEQRKKFEDLLKQRQRRQAQMQPGEGFRSRSGTTP